MATSVGQIGLDLVVNQGQFNKQMRGIESLAKKTGIALAGAFTVKKLVDFGKSAIKLGSDLEEVQNVVDTSFPSMTKQMHDWAKNAATSFGLSETMAKQYAGLYGAMSKAFGFTEKEAYNMSTALAGLAGDVASFYNISQDEAYTKLKSVFSGETETLKDLGVVMTQNALDQYALANGFGRTTSAMSEQEKVALRYQFVMSQLSLANGDFVRTSDSWANQVRVLKLQFESFMASVGGGLINIFSPVLKVINTLMGKLVALGNTFKSFTELLTGKKSKKQTSVANVANSSSDAKQGLSSVGNTAESTGKAVEGIGKAAKKSAKDMKSLMGFDQVNKLSEPSTSNSGGNSGSGGGGGGGAVGGGGVDFGSLPTEIEDSAPAKLGAEYKKLADAVDNLRNAFGMFVGIVKDAFVWVWENVLKPFGKWTITEVAPRVINILAGAFKILNAVLLGFKPIWLFMWQNFIKPIATFTGKVFITALEGISIALNGIGDWMLKHQSIVTAMEIAVLAFFGAWKVTKLVDFVKTAGGVTGVLKSMASSLNEVVIKKIKDKVETLQLMALYIKDTAITIKNTTAKGLNAVANSKLGQTVKSATTKIIAMTTAQKLGSVAALGIAGAIAGLAIYMGKTGTSAEEMAKKIEDFADDLAEGITSFADKLPKILPKLTKALENVIKSLIGSIPKLIPPLVNAGVSLFMALVKSIDKIVQPIINALPVIIDAVVKAIPILVPALINAGVKIFMALVQEIPIIIPQLVAAIPTIISALVSGLAQAGVALVKAFGDLFGQAIGKIKEVFSPITGWFGEKYSSIKNTFASVGTWFGEKFKGAYSSVKSAFSSMGTWAKEKYSSVKNAFSSVKTWFSEKFSSAYSSVKSAFSSMGTWAKEKYSSVKNAFSSVKTYFSDKFKGAYSSIKSAFSGIGSFFGGIYKTVTGKFKSVGTAIGNAMSGAFKGAMNAVISTVERAINKAIGLINGAIRLINKVPGVDIGRISPVSFPRLAQGGYVKANTPQLAMIGDNRHQGEVVAPENKLKEMAMKAVKEAGQNGGISKQELGTLLNDVVSKLATIFSETGIYVDSEQLAKAVRKGEGKLNRRFSPIG